MTWLLVLLILLALWGGFAVSKLLFVLVIVLIVAGITGRLRL